MNSATQTFLHPLERRILLNAGVAPDSTPLRINAGGGAYVDSLQRLFTADTGFTGGTTLQTAADIDNTPDDELFRSARAGESFAFSHALPAGNFTVFLHFAEPVHSAPGARTFDIHIEGQLVLDDYDIIAHAGGPNRAVAKSFDIAITDGTLDITFTAPAGQEALVSAITVAPLDPSDVAAPYSWIALDDTARAVHSANHLRNIGQALLLYANENRGRFPSDLATLHTTQMISHRFFASPRTGSMIPRDVLPLLEGHAWVESRSDYIYRGAGKLATVPANEILAHENPDRVNGGITVLWGDSSVSMLSRADAAERLGFDPDAAPSDPPPTWPSVAPQNPQIVQSQQNLLRIGADALAHANERQGRYPDRLGELHLTQDTPPQTFINPRIGGDPPPEHWTREQKAQWIDDNSHYAYVAAGRGITTMWNPATSDYDVFAYEHLDGVADGINILFGDGRVEFRELAWARDTLGWAVPPHIRNSEFRFNTGSHALVIDFSEYVGHSLKATDLVVQRLGDAEPLSPDAFQFHYSPFINRAIWSVKEAAGRWLADGNYRATLGASAVRDAAGNALAADHVLEFFVLAADANRDRVVNVLDFNILARNFAAQNVGFAGGDFNYDGIVNVLDFNLLAANFARTMPAPAPAPTSVPISASTPASSYLAPLAGPPASAGRLFPTNPQDPEEKAFEDLLATA